MKKKKFKVNDFGAKIPDNNGAIMRYIKIYLERKMQPNENPRDLDLQKQYIIAMLKKKGFYDATYDDLFLKRILLGQIQIPENKVPFSNKKISEKKSNLIHENQICSSKRVKKLQKLQSLYFEYCQKREHYSELFAAFQEYFGSYIDVYGGNLTEGDVLSLTRTLVEPREDLNEKNICK